MKVGHDHFTLDFVFCNEDLKQWDNPSETQNGSKNYQIYGPGVYATYIGKVIKVQTKEMQQTKNDLNKLKDIVIVTDLDGTLFGDCPEGKQALKNFNCFWIEYFLFLEEYSPSLVYSTGRCMNLFLDLKRSSHVLWPDHLIAGTGTFIYHYNKNTDAYDEDLNWQTKILQCWDFYKVTNEFDQLNNFNRHLDDQREQKYNSHYWTKAEDFEAAQTQIKEIKLKLKLNNVFINIITSGPDEFRYVDITSKKANKGKALKFLIKLLGLELTNCHVFGDSMNDLDMLLKSEGSATLVSNAQEQILSWLAENQEQGKIINHSSQQFANALTKKLKSLYNATATMKIC